MRVGKCYFFLKLLIKVWDLARNKMFFNCGIVPLLSTTIPYITAQLGSCSLKNGRCLRVDSHWAKVLPQNWKYVNKNKLGDVPPKCVSDKYKLTKFYLFKILIYWNNMVLGWWICLFLAWFLWGKNDFSGPKLIEKGMQAWTVGSGSGVVSAS